MIDKEFKQQTFLTRNDLESLVLQRCFNQRVCHSKFSPLLQGLIFLIFAILLSACSTTSETFDCDPGKGVGCRSVTTVNKMIDQGHFTSPLQSLSLTPIMGSSSQAMPFSEEIVLSDKTVVQRSPEQHMRVWVAPFQDEGGNFHEASLVHSVIQTGFWHVQGNPWGP